MESGWAILERSDLGNGEGKGWCEFGNIDHEGHDRGWKLAKHKDGLITEISERVYQLLDYGWKNVHIVTDHGWLLLPGGLPKIDLPAALTDNKWGRCAVVKDGATTDERLYPWFWNPERYFALANGISCFRNGEEYAHGGLSLQECFTLRLTVSLNKSASANMQVFITDVVWKGMRCTLAFDGVFLGLSVDIRKHPVEPKTSLVLDGKSKAVREDGKVSLVIDRDELEGEDAMIVVLAPGGDPVKQVPTVIGGD